MDGESMKHSALKFLISVFFSLILLSLAGYSADFIGNQDKITFQSHQTQAEQGNPNSQVKLGEFYEKGIGVEKNLVEAFKWYNKAAKQNNMTGMAEVARCYSNGIGIEKNLKLAKDYYDAFNFMKKNNAEFDWNNN
jgi:TPR repeat protein